jgi:hypothetical protein
MDIFANLDDSEDIFETKSKRKINESDIKETVLNYKPKTVYPKVIIQMLN